MCETIQMNNLKLMPVLATPTPQGRDSGARVYQQVHPPLRPRVCTHRCGCLTFTVSMQKFPPPTGPEFFQGGGIFLGGKFLLRKKAEEDFKGVFLRNGRARGGEPKS